MMQQDSNHVVNKPLYVVVVDIEVDFVFSTCLFMVETTLFDHAQTRLEILKFVNDSLL